jgi:hypothetical protein
MPWVGGPVEIVTVAVFAIAGLVVWLRRGRGYQGPRLMDDRNGIDHSALAAAEREARDAPPDAALRAPGAPTAVTPPPLPHNRSARTSDRDRSGS